MSSLNVCGCGLCELSFGGNSAEVGDNTMPGTGSPGFADYVVTGGRWTDNLGYSGGVTGTLGASGGVVAWSLAGAGFTDSTGAGFFSGSTVWLDNFMGFDYRAVLRAAFDAWSAVANIEFIQVEDDGGNIGGARGYPTIRVAGGYIDGQSGSNVLARAFFPASADYGGDIVFDSSNTAFFSNANNFFLTAVHEIGHALGLNHENVNLAIMNPFINTALTGLTTDDVNGIRAVYGSQDFGANTYYMPFTHDFMTIIDNCPSLTVMGTADSNSIRGSAGAETINGRGGNDTLNGGGGNDTLIGEDGDDYLNGDTGADAMFGGLGNDTYWIDNGGDTCMELSGEGTDTVQTFTLSATLSANIENLTLFGAGSIAGTGNSLANVLVGNQGNNTLSGLGGDDTLNGGAGNDIIDGGAGNDIAVFDGPLSQYQVQWDFELVRVMRSGETDILYNVEQVRFSDGDVSVDTLALPQSVVESLGATQLVSWGVRSYLRDSGGAGPSLKYQGAAVVAGQFGAAWTAIGAEQVGSGYQIAFKNGTQDQYAVWNVDGNGNMLDLPAGILSGASTTLQMLETTFQQDLNGSGQIGLVPVTIESFGSTRLVQLGSQFSLQDSGGAGPSLKYQGAAVVAGQFGAAWTAIGAEQVGSGYQIAFKNGTQDQYAVWNVDGNGNMLDLPAGILSGASTTLQMLETTFQQDLNGSGQIGLVPVTIESFGSTRLVQLGSEFSLQDSGGAGPSLKYQGAAVVAGQFGAWTAIGAEQVGSGYRIAFKSGDQYAVWNVDGNGNMLNLPAGILSGTSTTLQTLETTFQQDLNGSGQIGLVPVTIESFGSTRLVQLGSEFSLQDSGGAGPSLKYQGAAVVAGQFGAWTAIGAEQVSGGGYQIAFKSGDQYAVWNVDGNGNMLNLPAGILSGTSTTLQSLETTFQQDLNGNGQIGLVPTTIESFGATRLVQIGSQFFLQDGGGAGPSMKYQGAAYVEGQFGAWTAIGAEQVGSGYQAAFKNGSDDQYVVWNLDGNGNYTGNATGAVAGSDATLRALETTFQQDLNGSGLVGSGSGMDQLIQAIAGFPLTASSETVVSSERSDGLVLPLVSNWTQPQG